MAKKEVDDPGAVANATFNMTPMIDVVFQLIVVFLCSMKFKTLDQKIEAFLPKDVGLSTAPATADVETKINLKLRRRPGEDVTSVILLESRLGSGTQEGIWNVVTSRLKEFKARDAKVKGEIDADAEVPHGDVMRALDAFMAAELTTVTFRGTNLNKSDRLGQQPPRR